MTLLEHLNEKDRFAKACGMRLTEMSEGRAVAVMTVNESHLNGVDLCQGGVLFTLADLAAAAVNNSSGLVTVGIENTITFHSPARLGDVLTATAYEVSGKGKLPFCRIEIHNQSSMLIATGTSLGYKKNLPIEY